MRGTESRLGLSNAFVCLFLINHPSFQVYHVNAPGQEENAADLPESFVYPTMDELAGLIEEVVAHFDVKVNRNFII